jgi:hypothetical protein
LQRFEVVAVMVIVLDLAGSGRTCEGRGGMFKINYQFKHISKFEKFERLKQATYLKTRKQATPLVRPFINLNWVMVEGEAVAHGYPKAYRLDKGFRYKTS